MSTFQITGPDGRKYRVQGESPAGAMAALKKMLGEAANPNPRVDPATNQPRGVPEYVPPGVEGYDAQTGEVARQPRSMGASFAHGAADTGSFGFGDEIASTIAAGAGMLPGGHGKPRQQVLQEMRGMQSQAQQDNPGSHIAGQVAGGLAQGVATGGATFFPNATSLVGRMGAGALTGATYGGLYGAGSGEDLQSRSMGAATTGALGGVIGGAFPLAAAGVSRAYEAGRNALRARPIAGEVGRSPESLRMIGNVMDADGTRGPVGRANMAQAGPDAMLADAGPNARAVLDTSIQRGGPGAVAARQRISERTTRASHALTDVLDSTLGKPQGIGTAQNTIRDAARPQVSQAYQRAYRTPIDYATPAGREVEATINRIPPRIARTAIERANERMRWEGLPQQIMADIAEDGSVSFRQMPGVLQADYIKKGLDTIVSEGTDAVTGRLSPDAQLASEMARTLRNAVGEAVPAYRAALRTAADPLSEQAAIRTGARLLSPSMTRDQAAEAVRNMTPPERRALAQGLRSQIDDAMARVTRTVQDGDTEAREAIKALRDLSSRANREKVSLAIGREKADALFKKMDSVGRSFDLRASVAENSKTYARQATDRRVGQMTRPGVAGEAMAGNWMQAPKRLLQTFTGQTPERMTQRQDAVYGELSDILTSPGGPQLFSAIDRLGQTDQATQITADQIRRLLSGPQLSYPATVQSQQAVSGR